MVILSSVFVCLCVCVCGSWNIRVIYVQVQNFEVDADFRTNPMKPLWVLLTSVPNIGFFYGASRFTSSFIVLDFCRRPC